MRVKLRELLPPAYYGLFWDVYEGKNDEYWLKGGRGSGKSSFVSLTLLCLLLRDPLANVMIYRKVADSLRESVYPQMRWAAERLGLDDYFTYRLSPLEMIYQPTGQRVLFRGADDPEKSKGVKLSRGYFAALWFEEASAFHGMAELRTIQASVLRGKRGVTLLSYNPPVSAQNWVNAEALVKREGRRVHGSDYRDLPPEWLGATFLKQAEQLRTQDERTYRHMYLGEAVGTGGRVFDNVSIRRIAPQEREAFGACYAGLDFGFASDPDALVLCAYLKKEHKLYLYGEHVCAGQSLHALGEACRQKCEARVVRCDSASPREIAELRRLSVNAVGVRKGAGSVEHGIRWLRALGELVIDSALCPVAAREFSLYEYARDRNGTFLTECPDKDNHTIDAVRYALEPVMTEQVVRLKKGGIY
ncbi:MAG: PBSX family phage terminase large subunit [Clostridia bacterium]